MTSLKVVQELIEPAKITTPGEIERKYIQIGIIILIVWILWVLYLVCLLIRHRRVVQREQFAQVRERGLQTLETMRSSEGGARERRQTRTR